jgi:tRNA threonylcarbamoyl adenosine modification protein YeaZ
VNTQLAIDTSTSRTSVALIAGGAVIWSEFEDGATAHAEAVPRLVQRALAIENNISQVIVGMGPGPYTGLRAGISFAQAFAWARKIELRGVCSLDAIVCAAPHATDVMCTTRPALVPRNRLLRPKTTAAGGGAGGARGNDCC